MASLTGISVRIERGREWVSVLMEDMTEAEVDQWIQFNKNAGLPGWSWVKGLWLAIKDMKDGAPRA